MPSFDEFMRERHRPVAAGESVDVGRTPGAEGVAAPPRPRVAAGPMRVVAWTDGSSRGNPGPGGYGAVLLYRDPAGVVHRREFSQGYRRTTNNRMELLGVIVALEALRRPCEVEVHSDSQYVCNAFNKNWVTGWLRRGWRNAQKQPVKNVDLWKRLLAAKGPHQVSFVWVKGHAGTELNERCDQLATSAADGASGPLLDDRGFTD